VPEYDAVRGRVLDWKQSFARHEKIARIAEARLGHEIVAGRFNASVSHALQVEGQHDLATKMAEVAGLPLPNSAYTTVQHQQAGRKGIDLPADKLIIKSAWEQSDGVQAFRSALAEQGIDIRAGDKKGVWVAERDGELVGAIHRLVGVKAVEVDARMLIAPDLASTTPTESPVVAISEVVPSAERPETPTTARISTIEPVGELRETSRPTEALAVRGGGSSGGGGGQTAETSPPAGTSADHEAIDGPGEPPGANATPEEQARYRKRLYEYEQKKAQQAERARKALAIRPTGGNHGANQTQNNHSRHQQPRISFPWTDARRQGAGNPDRERPQGLERGDVVSNSSGSELREPPRHVDAVGADRERSLHQPDDFDLVGGAGPGNRPHGEKADHTRIEDRRFTRTLSDALTASQSDRFAQIIAKLREAPTAESMAREQIEIRRRDIAGSLRGKPWSQPEEISAKFLAEKIQKTARSEMADRRQYVEQARQNAIKAKAEIPVWQSVWPFKTDAKAKAEELEREALAIQVRMSGLNHADDLRIKDAPTTANAIVRSRLAEVKAWEARPAIAQALEEERLLFKVSASVSFGDERITAFLLDGRIDLAMAEERKREEAEQRHLERQLDAQDDAKSVMRV
jgi:hypothetical protein